MNIVRQDAYTKRNPIYIDRTVGIQAWGSDNLYPQRADQTRKKSFTTKIAVKRLAGFLSGRGFTDPLLGNMVVNSEGQTWNDVLRLMAKSAAMIEGSYVLHLKHNLLGQISEIIPVSIENARFGMPDQDGDVFDIKICNNWEQDPYKNVNLVRQVYEYPIFNLDPEVVKSQIAEYGTDAYPGQMLFKTPTPNIYSDATFDAVMDHAETQGAIGRYNYKAVKNGFTGTTIVKSPGKFNSKEERQEFQRDLNTMKGEENANAIIVVENENGAMDDAKKFVEHLTPPNTDKMYEVTERVTKNSIRENFSFPMEILGATPESGMFNKESIAESFAYVNAFTEEDRDDISSQVAKIMRNFVRPVTMGDWSITPQSYGTTVNNAI